MLPSCDLDGDAEVADTLFRLLVLPSCDLDGTAEVADALSRLLVLPRSGLLTQLPCRVMKALSFAFSHGQPTTSKKIRLVVPMILVPVWPSNLATVSAYEGFKCCTFPRTVENDTPRCADDLNISMTF